MKLSNQSGIKTISLIALAIGAIYLFFVYYRTICCLWFNEAPERIVWSAVQKPWQITVLIGYVLGATAMFALCVSSKVDFHQSGTEKGTRERVRSKVTKFGYHYKFLSSF